jgi:hypothetical protein
MTQQPDDLLIAYQNFTLLASKYGFAFAGVMMSADPPSILVIGNVTEKGHEFVRLLREYADIIEEKIDRGQLERPMFSKPH